MKFSDFILHMPVIEWFASQCDHLTEFGMREGFSTVALLNGAKTRLRSGFHNRPEVHSWDIRQQSFYRWMTANQADLPCHWEFHQGDTGSPVEVAETDLLLVDTLHTYEHVTKELAHHGRKARKYLIFHDTYTCGQTDRSGSNPNEEGIIRAIKEFLGKYPEQYQLVYETWWSNGLMVFERKY